MKNICLAFAFIGCSHFSRAADAVGWTSPSVGESVVLAAAEAATLIDVLQTADLPNHPDLRETNPLLGENPSSGSLIAAAGGAMVSEAALWWLLPPPWRSVFAAGVGGYEVAVCAHHVRLGLSVRF